MAEKERKAGLIEYKFLVGIDLFSRFAFVKWFRICKKGDSCVKGSVPESELIEITEEPDEEVDAEGYREDLEDDGKSFSLGAKQVIEGLKEWLEEIKKMGYDLQRFISDNGPEYIARDTVKFLEDNGIDQGFVVPNDKLKNPIAERFIGTFRRLVGQYMAMEGKEELTPKDIKKIVDFYNDRIHSSTGYSPREVLTGDKNQDSTLFNYYRALKNDMYYTMPDEIPMGTAVRIYNKWKTADKNIGDKKANVPNWSATLYRIVRLDKSKNSYILERIGEKDKRDRKFLDPPKDGLRKEYLQVVDEEKLRKYSI